jgi:transcription antitermination factor NusG
MLMVNEGGLKPIADALKSNVIPIATEPTRGMMMIIVRPGQYQRARDSLRRRGVGAWWPNYPNDETYKDKQTGKRQTRCVLSAVMPGVILTPANYPKIFWDALDLAPGVVNVARMNGGGFLILDDLEVVLIHKIEAGLNSPPPIGQPVHSFKVGDKVRFVDDVMRRLPSGKVTKVVKSGHIMVEVNWLGRPTSFDVLPHQIEPALEESKRIRA